MTIESFPLPKRIDGLQLAAELNVDRYAVWVVGDVLYIDTPPADVKTIIANHVPALPPKPLADLIDAAATLDELKTLLKERL